MTREGVAFASLVVLTAALGLYYEAKDVRALQQLRATMPAAMVPPPQAREAVATQREKPEVTHFRIGQRNVKSIYSDVDAMWVATSDGLIRYDRASEKHEMFDRRHGLASPNVFFVGRVNGAVLAGTAGGLAVFDEKRRTWTSSAAPGAGAVLDVLQTKAGEIWIAGLGGVLQVPVGALGQPDKWLRHGVDNGLPAQPVYALAEGHRGEIWFGTERGVARLANGSWREWDFDGEQARVLALKVDARGHVWAGTWGKGLRRFDGNKWRAYGSGYVLSLFDDGRGTLWVGTDKGVARVRQGRVEKAFDADKVFALARTADDSLWVGGFGGVARIRPAGAL